EPEAGREQGESSIERTLEVALAHEGADPQRSARLRHAVESGHAIDVDEHGRPGQPEVQHRGQALAAGQDLCLVAVPTQVVERLVDRARIDVVERRRLHAVSWSNASRRAGLTGVAVMRTPNGSSAASIALALAARRAVAPAP